MLGSTVHQASKAWPQERDALSVGALVVRQAQRRLEGPAGVATLEPKVMQVFLVLVRAGTEVVAREALLDGCWPNLVVGEDSLNRAIAELRKALRQVGGGVVVETIPKSGYRLCVDPVERADAPADAVATGGPARVATIGGHAAPPPSSARLSRRTALLAGAGCAGALATGTFASRYSASFRHAARAADLVAQATVIMRDDPWGTIDPMVLLREAVRLDPGSAKAWGVYALASRDFARNVAPPPAFGAIAECRAAADRALALDPGQVEALTALATLDPVYANWWASGQRFQDLVRRFPDQEAPLLAMAELHASTGRAAAQLEVRARLADLEPTSIQYALRAAVAAWMAGDALQQEARLGRILRTWPAGTNAVDAVRFMLLGFGGHPEQALDLVATAGSPIDNPPLAFEARVAAFKVRAGHGDLQAAIDAALAAARRSQSSAAQMIPLLAFLGAVDEAFAVADGYYLQRGDVKVPNKFGATRASIVEMRDRSTVWLFAPAGRSLWPDPRFRALCQEIGLVDYWRSARLRPDLPGLQSFAL